MTLSAASVSHVADLLDRFDFHALLSGAAHLRPDHAALTEHTAAGIASITFAEFDRRAHGLAHALRETDYRPNDHVLINAGASMNATIALAAVLRAGLHAVLAPLHLNVGEIGALARQSGAVALIGEARAGEEAFIENLFSVAALASDVRMVCSVGETEVDGAVPYDPQMLAPEARDVTPHARSRIFTAASNGRLVEHQQSTLVAAALDFAARAHIGSDAPLLTTFAPMTFAGLVTGPFASLLTGAGLTLLDAPSAATLAEAASKSPAHLVVPAALADAMDEAGLADGSRIRTLVSVCRGEVADGIERLAPIFARDRRRAACVDLYAIGESAAVAEARTADVPQAPAAEPHMITLDNHSTIAVQRSTADGSLEGCAVTSPRSHS